MDDELLNAARDALLKQIAEMAAEVDTAGQLQSLAEAYAAVNGSK